jgi:hypothetical protein
MGELPDERMLSGSLECNPCTSLDTNFGIGGSDWPAVDSDSESTPESLPHCGWDHTETNSVALSPQANYTD